MWDDWDEGDDEITYEEEMKMLERHARTCNKAAQDVYCKVCHEY